MRMKGLLSLVIVALSLNAAAQLLPQPSAPAGPQGPAAAPVQPPPPTPLGRMYAIHARGAVPEKLHVDEKLKPVAKLLSNLPFTSFDVISMHDNEMPWGQETLFPINAVYAMHVMPQALDEEQSITLRARVEMLQESGDYINALDTMAQAAPQQALLFRGMPLNSDELVIILLVGMPPDPNQSQDDSQQSEEQPPEQQEASKTEPNAEGETPENNEGEGEESREGEQEKAEEGEMMQQDPQSAGEGESNEEQAQSLDADEQEGEHPKGTENLEALLQSLEEIDKDEQVKERNRRDSIDFNGDWW